MKNLRTKMIAGLVPVALVSLTATSALAAPAGAGGQSSPPAARPLTAADQSLRQDIARYLGGLDGAVTAAAANSHLRQGAARESDQRAAVALAEQQVARLDARQLEALRTILGRQQGWAAGPGQMAAALSAPGGATHAAGGPQRAATSARPLTAAASTPAGYLSDCTASVGDPEGLFYGYWAAAQVASAAQAIASGLPDGVDFTPALIIAGVAYGVANGIAIALQGNLSLSQDCATAVSNATLASAFPTDPSSSDPQHYTPASSQISVNQLTSLVGGVKTTLDALQILTNSITSTLAGVINSVGTGQGTATTTQATSKDLQQRSDDLLTSIGAVTDTTTATANGLANLINGREDTTLTNTAALQALDVRAQIERNLAEPSAPVIALFALPAARGGYLEVTRDIVTTTIAQEVAAGQSVFNASAQLAGGNAALAAGQYESAYVDYAQAYRSAVK